MKRFFIGAIILLAVSGISVTGQDFCHVGNSAGESQSNYFPYVSWRALSETQYVLTAEVLESCFPGSGSSIITQIGWHFYHWGSGSNPSDNTLNVYMYQVESPCDVNVCSNRYPNGTQVVFEKSLPVASGMGWRMLVLDEPFVYTHGNCLVISVCDVNPASGGWTGYFTFNNAPGSGNGYALSTNNTSPLLDCDLETQDAGTSTDCLNGWPSTRFQFESAPDPPPVNPSNCSAVPDQICFGDSDDIELTADHGDGDVLYWFINQPTQPGSPASHVAIGSPADVPAPTETTTYYAWSYNIITDLWSAEHCSVIVTVSDLPDTSASYNDDPPLEEGDTLELYGEPSGLEYTYLWTRTQDDWESTVQNPTIADVTGFDSDTYTLRVTNINTGCFADDTVTVIIGDGPPPPPIPATGPFGIGLLLLSFGILVRFAKRKK